jgi:cysteine desulfurase family protein (TIGR01976 family)
MISTISAFAPEIARAQFPALQRIVHGKLVAFLDAPGGTQAPRTVIEAMSSYLEGGLSNRGGSFVTSRETDDTVAVARIAMMDFLNAARPQEIVFGQNMTSLTFAMSRSLARDWKPGDEIIVTRNDHDANVAPWLLVAQDCGMKIRWLDTRLEDCTLMLEELPRLLNEKTRLVAVTFASNAVGSITDVKQVARLARENGSMVYVDAVHYAPHGLIDVQELGCDFLVSSAYKYFGPHTGILYGRYELLDSLQAYKVRPAPDRPAGKWETGTQSFESLAGVTAAVDYIASLGGAEGTRRQRLVRAMARIKQYEMGLSAHFLTGATQVEGLRVFGITDMESLEQRTPTFAVRLAGYTPQEVASYLSDQGIFVWDGDYYAIEVMRRLGFLEDGGLVRIGFVHYSTHEEVDRVLSGLGELAERRRNR